MTESTVQERPATIAGPEPADPPRRLWRLAGALALAHVVVSFGAIPLQNAPLFQEGPAGITRTYGAGHLERSVAGGILGAFGFVLLLPVLVFLARAVGRRTEAGRWAAQTGLLAGVAYVAVILAAGYPAGGAALYGTQHGLDVDTAFALNNLRVFAYFLSLFLLGLHALGVAIAARQDGWLPRWGGLGRADRRSSADRLRAGRRLRPARHRRSGLAGLVGGPRPGPAAAPPGVRRGLAFCRGQAAAGPH